MISNEIWQEFEYILEDGYKEYIEQDNNNKIIMMKVL